MSIADQYRMRPRLTVDGISVVDEQEALLLMNHHLDLAARYFEVTPIDLRDDQLGDDPAKIKWVAIMESRYSQD